MHTVYSLEIGVSDYIDHVSLRKHEFGIKNFHVSRKSALEPTVLHSKIFPGERKTFIDRYLKTKSHVPDVFYELAGNIILKQKS